MNATRTPPTPSASSPRQKPPSSPASTPRRPRAGRRRHLVPRRRPVPPPRRRARRQRPPRRRGGRRRLRRRRRAGAHPGRSSGHTGRAGGRRAGTRADRGLRGLHPLRADRRGDDGSPDPAVPARRHRGHHHARAAPDRLGPHGRLPRRRPRPRTPGVQPRRPDAVRRVRQPCGRPRPRSSSGRRRWSTTRPGRAGPTRRRCSRWRRRGGRRADGRRPRPLGLLPDEGGGLGAGVGCPLGKRVRTIVRILFLVARDRETLALWTFCSACVLHQPTAQSPRIRSLYAAACDRLFSWVRLRTYCLEPLHVPARIPPDEPCAAGPPACRQPLRRRAVRRTRTCPTATSRPVSPRPIRSRGGAQVAMAKGALGAGPATR